jgi:ABC-2 type transport system ATP-binding protein
MFKDYSTGMRQKLAIARGLLTDPDVIFMDEPTKALDPITAYNIRKLIREKVIGERKRSVLYATHNLQEAEELCDRLAIISEGSIKYVGTVDALKKKFRHDTRYIIRVSNAENDLIGRIASIPSLQKISVHSNGPSHDSVQFEAVPDTNSGNISHIIGTIIKMGGNITSLSEKEPTLEEVFSKVVLK